MTGPLDHRLAQLFDRLVGEVVLRYCPGRRVLDLGHGSPQLSDWAASRASRFAVVPRDRLRDPSSGDSMMNAWQPESFDTIFSVRTLAYLGESPAESEVALRATLEQVARLLAPDGTALLEIANATSLRRLVLGVRGPGIVHRADETIVGGRFEAHSIRYDTLRTFVRLLPPGLSATDARGVGVFTATESLLRLPITRSVLPRLEWYARDQPLLRFFGAGLLVLLHRVHV